MRYPVKEFIEDHVLRLRRKESFLRTLPPDCRILDVGCGNNSPLQTKRILPGCHYTGIDVADYNQASPECADRYILVKPEHFTREIEKFAGSFDAVLSAHNLEHCDDRIGTLQAMLAAVRPGGRIYLAFPCQASKHFPSRRGTLNYFDDPTHQGEPPDFEEIQRVLRRENFTAVFSTRQYKPAYKWFFGWFNERSSRTLGRNRWGTWEYYGFESIIWAQKAST